MITDPLYGASLTPVLTAPFGETLIAGDQWSWIQDVSALDFEPAAVKAFFRSDAGGSVDAEAEKGDDGRWTFTVASASTAELQPGQYQWQIAVYDGDGERTELGRGLVQVLPNIEAQEAGTDNRSHAKKVLDAIEAVIEGRASRVEKSYQVAGRMLSLLDPADLIKWRGYYRALYRQELIEAGQLSPDTNQVDVTFGGAPRVATF